jgi:uncharacterized protein (DUF58 family)
MAVKTLPPDPRVYTTLKNLQQLEGVSRRLSLLPRQLARSVLSGRHASRLRGRGLNFEELREYLAGDDIRTIDWKATARKREPHVRVYTEERDRPALVVVDQRQSMFFGTTLCLKSVTAAEAAAITAFMVLRAGDRIGGLVFDDAELVEFRPQRSRRALQSVLKTIAAKNNALRADTLPTPQPMKINKPLEAAARIARHDHLIVIISDFDGIDDNTHRHLSRLSRSNDVILMLVHDPWGMDLPQGVNLVATDGQLQIALDTRDRQTWRSVSEVAKGRLKKVLDWQNDLGLTVFPLSAGVETAGQIQTLLGHGPSAS